MLIRFLVGNYKSFNAIQEFSMIAGKTRTNPDHLIEDKPELKILRLAAIFGANASGKSNLISAIYFAQSVIMLNIDNIDNDLYHFDNKEKESYFEFEIKINDKYFSYGFEINIYKKEFVSEWLYEISPSGDKMLFNRDVLKGKIDIGFKNLRKEIADRILVYKEDIKNNKKISFLNEMNRNKDELYKGNSEVNVMKNVFNWFKKTLDVNYPEEPITNYSYLKTLNKDEVLNVIKSFGTGITDFSIVETSFDDLANNLPKELMERIKKDLSEIDLTEEEEQKEPHEFSITIRGKDSLYIISIEDNDKYSINTIVFEHESKKRKFKLSEESDGTKRLLDLIEVLMPLEDERVYFIDEIDRSLHPQLTYKFIDLFSKMSDNYNKQLIVTTHESRLLDFDLLRRDEIWFIQKDNGTSDLYSLEAFNERFDKKIDKAYLDGRYGGIPIFTSIYPIKEQFSEK